MNLQFGFCRFHQEFFTSACKFVNQNISWFGCNKVLVYPTHGFIIIVLQTGGNFTLLQATILLSLSRCWWCWDWPCRIGDGSGPVYLWEDPGFASWSCLGQMLRRRDLVSAHKVSPELRLHLGRWTGSGRYVEPQVPSPGWCSTCCRKCWVWSGPSCWWLG